MSAYWPWWAGAAGLAALTISYTLATDRSFGVSGAWDRVLHWHRERDLERADEEFADERALGAALVAATDDHFGATSAAPVPSQASNREPSPAPFAGPLAGEDVTVTRQRPAPLVTQAALLISIFVGGLIASLASGRFHLRLDMGPGFRNLVTADPIGMVALLFVGGVLVGFGTRLAGGCSSGHGLNGCGRLDPVSIVATATFFGTAVAVSFLLWKVV
ncbi:YeeE/YedE family protein [Streptomyces canus]|uniref:YeeE/YedE family protein n=1 Tax=Streptomyces canus TaxID=58343 RepID=UPI00037CD872|nr:YeeE/YedE thiosulfate transporter family protein [Streptomyces canus]